MAELNEVQAKVGIILPGTVAPLNFQGLIESVSHLDNPKAAATLNKDFLRAKAVETLNTLISPAMSGQPIEQNNFFMDTSEDGHNYSTLRRDFFTVMEGLTDGLDEANKQVAETVLTEVYNARYDDLSKKAQEVYQNHNVTQATTAINSLITVGDYDEAAELTEASSRLGLFTDEHERAVYDQIEIQRDLDNVHQVMTNDLEVLVEQYAQRENDRRELDRQQGKSSDPSYQGLPPISLDEAWTLFQPQIKEEIRKRIYNSELYQGFETTTSRVPLMKDDGTPMTSLITGEQLYDTKLEVKTDEEGNPVERGSRGVGLTSDGYEKAIDDAFLRIGNNFTDMQNSRIRMSKDFEIQHSSIVTSIEENVNIAGLPLDRAAALDEVDQLKALMQRGVMRPEEAMPLIRPLMGLLDGSDPFNTYPEEAKIALRQELEKTVVNLASSPMNYENAMMRVRRISVSVDGEEYPITYQLYKTWQDEFSILSTNETISKATTNALKAFSNQPDKQRQILALVPALRDMVMADSTKMADVEAVATAMFMLQDDLPKVKWIDRIVTGEYTPDVAKENIAKVDTGAAALNPGDLRAYSSSVMGLSDDFSVNPKTGTFDNTELAEAIGMDAYGACAMYADKRFRLVSKDGSVAEGLPIGEPRVTKIAGEERTLIPFMMVHATPEIGRDGEQTITYKPDKAWLPDDDKQPIWYAYQQDDGSLGFIAINDNDFMGGTLSATQNKLYNAYLNSDISHLSEDFGGDWKMPVGWDQKKEEQAVWDLLTHTFHQEITGAPDPETDPYGYEYKYSPEGFLLSEGFAPHQATTFQPRGLGWLAEQTGRSMGELEELQDGDRNILSLGFKDGEAYVKVTKNPDYKIPDVYNDDEQMTAGQLIDNATKYDLSEEEAVRRAYPILAERVSTILEDDLNAEEKKSRLKTLLFGYKRRDEESYNKLIRMIEAEGISMR